MKIAAAFPGQASQEVGMGTGLKQNYSYVSELYGIANDTLGFDIAKLIETGPIEELTKTENAQPAILLASYAAFLVLERELGFAPSCYVGHSLGEYSALVAAGAVSFRDALILVRERGRLMQEACPLGEGAMAAVMGLTGYQAGMLVDKSRGKDILDLANYNAPSQLVISGSKVAVERACELAPKMDAKKCIMLNVSAPFHSELMLPAVEKFRPKLDATKFNAPKGLVIANYSAEPYPDTKSIPRLLAKQIDHPVLYYQSIEWMFLEGVDTFIEVGPGKVLTGLNKRILKDKPVTFANFGTPEDLAGIKELLATGGKDA